jgi:hypothetical protein
LLTCAYGDAVADPRWVCLWELARLTAAAGVVASRAVPPASCGCS